MEMRLTTMDMQLQSVVALMGFAIKAGATAAVAPPPAPAPPAQPAYGATPAAPPPQQQQPLLYQIVPTSAAPKQF